MRKLNHLLESGEYQLPKGMRDSIAAAAHWIVPLVILLASILVCVASYWLLAPADWESAPTKAGLMLIGMVQVLFVGSASFLTFGYKLDPPRHWNSLEESCKFFGLTLDQLARMPVSAQTQLCEQSLIQLAWEVMGAERKHPGLEYHEDRLAAKARFQTAFYHFQQVGWIGWDVGYGKFFVAAIPK